MPVDNDLLKILCCPATKVPVQILLHTKLLMINDYISRGLVKYADGSLVEDPLEEALVTEDGKTIYRVANSVPIMLVHLGIPSQQLRNFSNSA